MSAFAPETDSEDELPPSWEERATLDGEVFYANHDLKTTQWSHPRTNRKKRVPKALPFGWERKIGSDGKVIYIDHENRKTTFTDPRLAFAFEVKEEGQQEAKVDFRQRFDASTTAMAVVHGADLTGKVAVVTGANSGIGREISRTLAFKGCTVIMGCRSLEKGQKAASEIRSERPHAKMLVRKLDLTSFKSVIRFAEEVINEFKKLDTLFLNAGVMGLNYQLTEDHLEEMFQVNYLSQVLLAFLLRDNLSKCLKPKIVCLTSESHRFAHVTSDTITKATMTPNAANFVSVDAYNASKLYLMIFALEASDRWYKHGIRSIAVHPGNLVYTNLCRHSYLHRLICVLSRPWVKSLQQAASTPVFAALAPEMADTCGAYIVNCFPTDASSLARDVVARNRVWALTKEILSERLEVDFDGNLDLREF